jgi:arylsulfatase A-like enzyme
MHINIKRRRNIVSRPNILLITTDQQRFDTIHALGNNQIYTPHLNWLVDEGITFERCYSDNPVCMPARATIMTGKHAYNHGLITNTQEVRPMVPSQTLPGILTKNGYQTRAQGKMHFEPIRANYGFEHMELPMEYYKSMSENRDRGVPKGHGVGENEIEPVISTVDETKSAVYWTVNRSIDFLETRDDTRPFFLWTSFAKPHPPFDPCANYWALYQNKKLTAPVCGDWSTDQQSAYQGFYHPTYMLNNAYRMSEEQLLDVKRAYYACITQIDYSMGLLFARMHEMDLLKNTWIIFTADHGDMMGDHRMGAKGVFLEGSAHIPMIVRPPLTEQGSKGRRCSKLVTLADVMPTILAAADIQIPDGTDGLDMMEIESKSGKDRTFYGNFSNNYFAVMEDGYKYMWTAFGGEELLFYMPDDPMEQRNLANIEKNIAKRMKRMLTEQVAGYNADLVQNGELVIKECIEGPQDINKWPGFHSITAVCDVLH